nr:TfuA-like protein [uncultured Dongia sp.]
MERRIVFVGPSLHGSDRPWPARLERRPPAAKGDLLAAVLEGATAIGLIDGTFDHGAAVWHKEILFALDRGVAVLGAASMGALRAAECSAFGMIGIGSIYEDYAAGRRQADEDVALVHGPAELCFPPLTEALVDIDATLDHLLDRGLIAAALKEHLAEAARALHFKDRSWDRLCDPAVRSLVRENLIDRKGEDAWLLIEAMARELPKPTRIITGAFSETLFFSELKRDVMRRS